MYYSIESYVKFVKSEKELQNDTKLDSIKNGSNEELFKNMIFWKNKLQHHLNLKNNYEYYNACTVKEVNEGEYDDEMVSGSDALNTAALNYHRYFSALEKREKKELYSESDLDTEIICNICDTTNERDANMCNGCEEIFDSIKESNQKKLLSDSNNTRERPRDASIDDDYQPHDLSNLHSGNNDIGSWENIENVSPEVKDRDIIDRTHKEDMSMTDKSDNNESLKSDKYSHNGNNAASKKKWNCDKCTFANDFNGKNCSVCGSCKQCTFINMIGVRKCGGCDTIDNDTRFDDTSVCDNDECEEPSNNGCLSFLKTFDRRKISPRQMETLSQHKWVCVKCELLNSFNQLNCVACHVLISEDCKWVCNGCTLKNSLFAKKCSACKRPNEMVTEYEQYFNAGDSNCSFL